MSLNDDLESKLLMLCFLYGGGSEDVTQLVFDKLPYFCFLIMLLLFDFLGVEALILLFVSQSDLCLFPLVNHVKYKFKNLSSMPI